MLAIDHLTYDDVISNIAKVVEAIGALIMVIGGLWAFLISASRPCTPSSVRVHINGFGAAWTSHSHWAGIS